MADGYIGLFRVPDVGVTKIILDGNPTLAVSEDNISYNSKVGGISNALITVSDIDVTAGDITAIVTAYKVTGAGDSTYSKKIHAVNIAEGTSSGTSNLVIEGLKVFGEDITTITYDFKVWFLNADQQYAYNGTDDIEESSHYLSAAAQAFNGIDDIAELFEVMDLACINEGVAGEGGGATATLLNRDLAKLTWTTDVPGFKITASDTRVVSGITDDKQFRDSVKGYSVYLYEATAASEPENQWPTNPDANGVWSKLIDTADTTIEVAVPHNKNIAFWVGIKVKGTTVNPTA